ncbi:MAG: YtxH domain-containing protein [Patescibacteria group bacterium]
MDEQNTNPEKKKSIVDKLVMGAIIGGAIGSVLGVAFAPRKGRDTRKIIKEKGKELYEKHGSVVKDLAEKAKEESKGIFNFIKNNFLKNNDEEKGRRK